MIKQRKVNNIFGLGGRIIGFYYKTGGGFFRAYSYLWGGCGYGPFMSHNDAIQWVMNEEYGPSPVK